MRNRVYFSVESTELTAFFEWCRTTRCAVKTYKRDEKTGRYIFSLPRAAFDRLRAETEISVIVLRTVGPLICLQKWRKRPGLSVGLLLALALVVTSRFFLWEVRVADCDGMTPDEVRSTLKEIGIAPGAFLPRLDTAAAALRLRQTDERIGYAAVNLCGTVIEVQVRTVKTEPPRPVAAPANLVAAEDGVIREILVFAGECLVGEGDVVRKGQVLVRGSYTAGEEKTTIRATRAAGTVRAETTHTARIEVPFEYVVRQRTGRRKKERTLVFFGVRQNLFKITGNKYDNCDIIEMESRLPVGNGRFLPVGLSVRTLFETADLTVTRTAEEAVEEARRQWTERFGEQADRTVLSVRETVEPTSEGIAVTFAVVCEENIAVTQETSFLP